MSVYREVWFFVNVYVFRRDLVKCSKSSSYYDTQYKHSYLRTTRCHYLLSSRPNEQKIPESTPHIRGQNLNRELPVKRNPFGNKRDKSVGEDV